MTTKTNVWEEVIFERDVKDIKKIKYKNRVQFYHREGDFKVLNSNKKLICSGHTTDMGMMISHLVHKYDSNDTYKIIDQTKKNRIYFMETVKVPKIKMPIKK